MGEFRNLMIAVIIFGVFFTSGIFLMGDLISWYGVAPDQTTNAKLGDSFNKINATYDLSMGMQDKLQNSSTTQQEGIVFSIGKGSAAALKMFLQMGGILTSIVEGIANFFGIPAFMVKAAIAIIIITIITILLAALFRTQL